MQPTKIVKKEIPNSPKAQDSVANTEGTGLLSSVVWAPQSNYWQRADIQLPASSESTWDRGLSRNQQQHFHGTF